MNIDQLPPPPKEIVPSVLEQARAMGWKADLYSFGKAEERGLDWFNPGLVERPDGLWLLVRRADMNVNNGFGMNRVVALKLDKSGTQPLHGEVLKWDTPDPEQQFEDSRGIYIPHMDQVAVSACTFRWYGRNVEPAWSGAIQVLGFFRRDWSCAAMHYVPFDTNATRLENIHPDRYQKNWVWWHRNGKLHLLYKSEPWTVATFENDWVHSCTHYIGKPLTWPYGTIRGGTPPIEVDGKLITFFHSSLPWWGRWRRYLVGALEFEAEPPFRPLRMTPEPLLKGSCRDPWAVGKPPCIFPCGAVRRGSRVLMVAGVNDCRAAWFEFTIQSVLNRLARIEPREVERTVEIAPEPEAEPEVEPTEAVTEAPEPAKAAPEVPVPDVKELRRKVRARRKKRLAKLARA